MPEAGVAPREDGSFGRLQTAVEPAVARCALISSRGRAARDADGASAGAADPGGGVQGFEGATAASGAAAAAASIVELRDELRC